jgi:hypothetical protein
MTIELEKVMSIANTMTVLANQKRALKEEFEQSLIFFFNGGSFKVTKELISFVHSIKIISNYTEFVLIDDSGTPIRIEDLDKFLMDIVHVYVASTNSYLADYQKLKNSKTVESILDL